MQEWLRKCIYQRIHFKSKTASQVYVFAISAFWHGFYGAYYISFVLWFAQLHLNTLIFRYTKSGQSKIAKLYKKSGKVGYFILSLLTLVSFSHCGAYFMVLKGSYCLQLLIKLKFIPQMLLFGVIAFFTVKRPPKDRSKPNTES